MKILGRPILEDLKRDHSDAAKRLDAWCLLVEQATWSSPHEIKENFDKTVDFPGGNVAIFNIKGNQYRVVAEIDYTRKIVIITKAGKHTEYIKWRLK